MRKACEETMRNPAVPKPAMHSVKMEAIDKLKKEMNMLQRSGAMRMLPSFERCLDFYPCNLNPGTGASLSIPTFSITR